LCENNAIKVEEELLCPSVDAEPALVVMLGVFRGRTTPAVMLMPSPSTEMCAFTFYFSFVSFFFIIPKIFCTKQTNWMQVFPSGLIPSGSFCLYIRVVLEHLVTACR